MPLTPNDILQKRFPSAFRGLPADEVYAFLRTVADDLEQLAQDVASAKHEAQRLAEEVEEFRHMESTLKNTLVSSQKVGAEIRAEAEHRAELIVQEAELQAERLLHEADKRRIHLENEIRRMIEQRRRFQAEMAALLETHTRLLTQAGESLESHMAQTRQLGLEEWSGEEHASETENDDMTNTQEPDAPSTDSAS